MRAAALAPPLSVSRYCKGTKATYSTRAWAAVHAGHKRGIMKIIFTVIGFLIMLVGVSFFGTAIILGWRKWARLRRFTRTTGVVFHVETSQSDHFDEPSSTLYRPTVRFQTADGRVVDHTPATSNNIA